MQWDTQHKPKPSNPCNKNRIESAYVHMLAKVQFI